MHRIDRTRAWLLAACALGAHVVFSASSIASSVAMGASAAVGVQAGSSSGRVHSVIVQQPRSRVSAGATSQVLREKPVGVDAPSLARAASERIGTYHVELFDGRSVTLTPTMTDVHAPERFSLAGSIDGEEAGWWVMAVVDDAVIMHIASPSIGSYELRPDSTRRMMLQQLDVSKFDGCGCGSVPPPPAEQPARDDGGVAGSPPTGCDPVVDVLVLYTANAMADVGSEAAIKALALASVASTNLSYANSGITARLRLIHSQLTNYVESADTSTDVVRLLANGDGHMDEAFALRNQYGADLVSVLTGQESGNCGSGYVLPSVAPSSETIFTTAVRQSCAVGSLTFAHEIGHNLGCAHDRGDSLVGATPYAYGHRFIGSSGRQWRTIMARSPGDRVPQYSNPIVLFEGTATGVAQGLPQAADNAAVINQTAPILAGYRQAALQDCNGNGADDACDVLLGTSVDSNDNGILDECEASACLPAPTWRIASSDAESFDRFGNAVALANDRMIVGAELESSSQATPFTGAAYIFRLENGAWVQEAKIVGAPSQGFDRFGRSVAITADGSLALVGSYLAENGAISDSGAVYVFRREGTAWLQEARLTAPAPVLGDWFGYVIALSGSPENELRAVVGAPNAENGVSNSGRAFIYKRTGTSWAFEQALVPLDVQASDAFGASVAAFEGDDIVIGSLGDDDGGTDAGSAYVFSRSGTNWTQAAKLVRTDPAQADNFGISCAITADMAVVGARGDDDAGDRSGSAYVFTRNGIVWSQAQKLVPAQAEAGDLFGTAVSMITDRLLIAAQQDRFAGIASGTARVYARVGDTWSEHLTLAPSDGAPYDNLGYSCAISADGAFAAAGALVDDSLTLVDTGSVRVFDLAASELDCNQNGEPDHCDVASGFSVDVDLDGIPDECQIDPCPADFLEPFGQVGLPELISVRDNWNAFGHPADVAPEGGDGFVGIADLLAVIGAWGPCP